MVNIELGILYDYYGELLTRKQQDFFEDYYFNNLTLQEIADNNEISRNAVHKTLNTIEKKLKYYEKILRLYEKSKRIKKIIEELDPEMKERINNLI